MAAAKKSAADSPSRSEQREGAQGGFPQDIPRSGARRHHDRVLTPAEQRKRREQREREQSQRADAQKSARADRRPKGWAARRRER